MTLRPRMLCTLAPDPTYRRSYGFGDGVRNLVHLQDKALLRLISGSIAVAAIPHGDVHAQRPTDRARERVSTASCAAARWTAPRQLASTDRRPAYVETPRIVVTRTGIAMFGSPAFVWGTTEGFAPPGMRSDPGRALRDFLLAGLLLRRDTTVEPIRMPAGVHHMDGPRAVSDGRGGAHVVWSTGSDTTSSGSSSKSLHYAHFDGTRWTAPERIHSARGIDWGAFYPTDPLLRGDTVHLAVAVLDSAGSALVHARRTRSGWRTTRIGRGGLPSFTSLEVDNAGAPIIAFAGSDPTVRGSDGQHLYVMRSDNGSGTWSTPTLVHRSGLGGVVQPRILASEGHVLNLVWAQRREGATLPDTVHVATSRDGGRTWRSGPRLGVPGGLRTLEAVIDWSGRLHIAGALARSTALTADGDVMYAMLHDDGWVRADKSIGVAASLPSLTLASSDSLFLVWGVARPTKVEGAATSAEAPVSMLAILSPLCSRGRAGS